MLNDDCYHAFGPFLVSAVLLVAKGPKNRHLATWGLSLLYSDHGEKIH